MDKRYQVFVSSTYADLKAERQQVLQALMEMDCIPAGMELFPAVDEEQWEFIKRVINDCDYYLLIIGGRYGSVTAEGISYTEKEFDYAVQLGLKVVALVHGSPEDIPFGKSEQDSVLREKLLDFKDKVMNGRLIKFWKSAEELPGLVALSLTRTIKTYPAIGWVRANNVANEDVLAEINELRKQNAALQSLLSEAENQQKPIIEDIANIDSTLIVHGTYETQTPGYSPRKHVFEYNLTWRELFSLISPYLVENPSDAYVKRKIASTLKKMATEDDKGHSYSIDDQEFKTITIQLTAYGLIQTMYSKTTQGGMALFWKLTEKGHSLMIESRVVKQKPSNV
ncbi:DUF4062 domain-containing protein [Acinetobacter baumannii]|uniref:DUF4062 domain-containing protein n=1 Tax=Acinetobacter baumannii TaxID=470 RepID=A0AAQ0WDV7_ACIBA|nr:DUF4062 domain-containing protein [Acinetobacter baumannii]EHU1921929.1 DUF4062 domain-containing protein [Acinetobacter baumannii]EHU1986750.1 DUF4062 domain-containing protein [Acinetobacter baumannii]EHU2638726.1 DUF4062 domain-containing protein [Acinetobacter baumannii]EHU3100473.1 DUF4062 domain-containing protein [Acinetobacter baumannii]EHU3110182.1 DUF4062 domain-containing protein [Acinetobacter baumannii]